MRHWYPSAGDPLAMPMAKFFRYLTQIAAIEEFKSGDDATPAGQLRKMMRGR